MGYHAPMRGRAPSFTNRALAGVADPGALPATRPLGATTATMLDVARRAGVSQSTVSRVLNGSPSRVPIADATRERVLAAAQDLGYRPNPLARGLKGSATMLLGVIVRDISDPFFIGSIDAISRLAYARGYNVVLGTAHSRADEAIQLRAVLETRHCDAIIVLGDMGDQPRLIEDLQQARVPVVALWQGMEAPGICNVNVDNRAGIALVMDHLLDAGHRRIAFVGGRPLGDIQERQAAFLERVRAEGLPHLQEYVQRVPNDPSGGSLALRTLVRLPQPPSAVVCSTDLIAVGVLHEAARSGIVVPRHLSVTGFDDLPVSPYLVPALTTVAMPIAAITELAMGAVMGALGEDVGCASGRQVVAPSLVIRASSGPPAD